jgi:alpha-glucosidase
MKSGEIIFRNPKTNTEEIIDNLGETISSDYYDLRYWYDLPDCLVKDAIFSDESELFLTPCEPNPGDSVKIRIRTAMDNVEKVIIHIGGETHEMQPAKRTSLFDYFEYEFVIGRERVFYYFEVINRQESTFYGRSGCGEEAHCKDFAFRITPGFKTPDWAKGAVMYQIFVDRFYDGNTESDVRTGEYYYLGGATVRSDDWYKHPANLGVREFYGGDLPGVLKKLDYLQQLGVEVIYLNPIFVSPSNHKYDIQDYDYVDPHFAALVKDGGALLMDGDADNTHAERYRTRVADKENLEAANAMFATLTAEIHRRGMKIILDGVFNHCGSFNKWLDREKIYSGVPGYPPGAYVSKDSPYRSFFYFRDENNWPDNDSYAGWWDHATLPKLNYEQSPELEEYILGIAKKWLSPPYNIDGWRLDVAADLGSSAEYNHKFWRKFREAVKSVNPEAIIIAEHYGDPAEWLKGDQWDTVMNYDAFMEPVTWFLTGMEKHSDEYHEDKLCNQEHFLGAMTYYMNRFDRSSLLTAMNELSNHDHSRFMTRTNRMVGRSANLGPESASMNINPAVMREAVVMQFTWPGAPTVYYGDEAGVCGYTDPDNRRTYPWGNEDKKLLAFHREVIHLHSSYQALKTGSLMILCANHGILCYSRFDKDDIFIIAINNNSDEQELVIPVWRTGMLEEMPICTLLTTTSEGYNFEAIIRKPNRGMLNLKLAPYSAVVLKNISQYI